ncbi:MAG: pyridoxal phosphate-dependent aminotransferase [Paracoccaceae bacterium]
MKDVLPNSIPRADRLKGLELSEIVQISERASRLRRQGKDIIALSTGEPDFPTPGFVIEAAMAAAREGETRYTPTAGTAELRAAVAAEHGREPSEIVISTGAKQVLANALLGTVNPGDEIVIPAPFWTSYADMVRVAGGIPIVIQCGAEQGFKLRPEQLQSAITARTRWLMLNSPSNPTGAIYTATEINALADVLRVRPHVAIISDEIYAHLSFERFTSFAAAAPDLADRTLIVSGVSKAWAMTGWRIGWGVGPTSLIKTITAVQGHSTSGASSVSQAAALAALGGDRALLTERRDTYLRRRNKVVQTLSAMPGLSCSVPAGAFYAFPSCPGDDGAFCGALLDQAGVAVVPGRAFGMPGHFRLSFAYSDADLDAGLERIARFLEGTKLTAAPATGFHPPAGKPILISEGRDDRRALVTKGH